MSSFCYRSTSSPDRMEPQRSIGLSRLTMILHATQEQTGAQHLGVMPHAGHRSHFTLQSVLPSNLFRFPQFDPDIMTQRDNLELTPVGQSLGLHAGRRRRCARHTRRRFVGKNGSSIRFIGFQKASASWGALQATQC